MVGKGQGVRSYDQGLEDSREIYLLPTHHPRGGMPWALCRAYSTTFRYSTSCFMEEGVAAEGRLGLLGSRGDRELFS